VDIYLKTGGYQLCCHQNATLLFPSAAETMYARERETKVAMMMKITFII
jgi:hypothetical protein